MRLHHGLMGWRGWLEMIPDHDDHAEDHERNGSNAEHSHMELSLV
jgi:hypothetical protein